jgi:hypothetical protein
MENDIFYDGMTKEEYFKPRCIYCKIGSTEENPMLFRVYAPGEYWQHWDLKTGGCKENIENRNPVGDIIIRVTN